MFRVRKVIRPLLDEFETLDIQHPDCSKISIGIIGGELPDYFEFAGNIDGAFELNVGISETGTDQEIVHAVYHILLKAIRFYPFTREEHAQIEALFEKHRPNLLSAPKPN
jgi:hypothetical protein